MNPLHVQFGELYCRHLCRHSQFAINLLHFIAVVGVYFSLFGVLLQLPAGLWIVGGLLAVYGAVTAMNVPPALWLANAVTIGLILAALLSALPEIPWWVHLLLIYFWHRFQNWNHNWYHEEHDMSQFKEKYKKGPALFVTLSVYELPILLNYLLLDRRPWAQRARRKCV